MKLQANCTRTGNNKMACFKIKNRPAPMA